MHERLLHSGSKILELNPSALHVAHETQMTPRLPQPRLHSIQNALPPPGSHLASRDAQLSIDIEFDLCCAQFIPHAVSHYDPVPGQLAQKIVQQAKDGFAEGKKIKPNRYRVLHSGLDASTKASGIAYVSGGLFRR